MRRYFSIRPLDTLFFRDAKPFSLGSESWADGVFPPFPSTILGAIRTWYISNHPSGPVEEVIQSAIEQVTLVKLAYRIKGENCLPLPLDFVELKREHEVSLDDQRHYEAVGLRPNEIDRTVVAANHFCPLVFADPTDKRIESIEGGLLSHDLLKTYLENYLGYEVGPVLKIKDWARTEPKTGIGRNNHTRTAAESQLYRVGMMRTQDFEIIVGVDLPDEFSSHMINDTYLIKLGAEGKAARLKSINDEFVINELEIKPVLEGGNKEASPCHFKIYLSTPGVFENGWYPDLRRYGIEAELLGAVVGKPQYVGGWDMKTRAPKPLLRAAPAGCVYFFKSERSTLNEIVEKISGKAISEPITFTEFNGKKSTVDLGKEGFGIAYIGKWNPER